MKMIHRAVLLLLVSMMFPAVLMAQEPDTKTYKATYKVLNKQTMIDIDGKVVKQMDSVFLQTDEGEIDSVIIAIASSKKGLLSNVNFGEKGESDKLFVNPFPLFDNRNGSLVDSHKVYYYQLENRQSIKIKFNHYAIKAITVPIKVRFGSDDLDFSTDANLGIFGGYSWGTTKFTRKEKVGNTEIEQKSTLGILLGTENLSFEFEDENQQKMEEESALISTGLGFVYSYQNFSVGLTGGFDFALGENRTKWEYHARPWLGLAIGYSIFSF